MPKSKPPAVHAPSRAGMPTLVMTDLIVSGSTPLAFKTYSNDSLRRRTRPLAHDLLAAEHRPLELVDLGLRAQEHAVAAGQRAEHHRLVGGLAVVDVHRHFRTGEADVCAVRQHQRANAVAAARADEFDLESLLLHVALAECDIHRRVELRAEHLARP